MLARLQKTWRMLKLSIMKSKRPFLVRLTHFGLNDYYLSFFSAMSGNTFGTIFRITTWGESHGRAVGVDGCLAGLALDAADIQKELDRRKPGQSRASTARKEADRVEILSGIFEGRTTGTPIMPTR